MSNLCYKHYRSMEVVSKCWKCRINELEAEVAALKERLQSLKPVYSTAKNSSEVRKGYEMSGSIKHYTIDRVDGNYLAALLKEGE